MKIRIVLDGTRYYLHEVTSDPNVSTRRLTKPGGKPLYFTKRGAAESYVAARAAQQWSLV